MRLVLFILLLVSLTACSLIDQFIPKDLFLQERVARGQNVAARLIGTGVDASRNLQITVGGEAAEVVSFNSSLVVFTVPRLEPDEEEAAPPVEELEVVISDGETEAIDTIEVAGSVVPNAVIALLGEDESVAQLQETLDEVSRQLEGLDDGLFGNLEGFTGLRLFDAASGVVEGYTPFLQNPRPLFETPDNAAVFVEGPCAGLLALVELNGAPLAEALALLRQIDPDLPVDGERAVSGSQASVDYLSAINAPQAFETGFTGAGTTVAVLDTGVSEDAELGGRLLADLGFDYVNGADPLDDDYTDPLTQTDLHGTPIARLAAGGTSGVARGADVLPIKVCDEDGVCRLSAVVLGICHALVNAPQGPDSLVLNMSFGGEVEDAEVLEVLLDYAVGQNTLVAASMGNEGEAAQGMSHVPASLPVDGLVAVGALEQDGESWRAWTESLTRGSSYGTHADLAAPGAGLFGQYTGTSFSTPLVAGAMALIREANPNATPVEVETCLTSTAQPVDGPQEAVGAGLLDVAAAVEACLP